MTAEVEEDDPEFIDSTLSLMGAMLSRTDVDYEATRYSEAEMDEFDEDIAAARAKLKDAVAVAVAEVKLSAKDKKIARIRTKIEKHQMKIAALEKKLQAVLDKGKEEAPAMEKEEAPAMEEAKETGL